MNVLVVGASENPERYSNRAMLLLKKYGHKVAAVGLRAGKVDDMIIEREFPATTEIHTVTLYVGPKHQSEIMDKVIALQPQRVIFNPGTENPEFQKKLSAAGIPYEEACTLLLLNTGLF